MVNSNLCLIVMKHDLNLTLKEYKVVFSDKQITEIKKTMHMDPIFTYSDSEITLKVKDSNSTVDTCGYFLPSSFPASFFLNVSLQ